MSTVSLSSNPLTTLMPWTSANQQPNFNNAFNFTPNGFNSVQDIALNTLQSDLSKPQGSMNAISFQDQNTQNINNRIIELSKRPSSVIPKTPKPNLMQRFQLSTFGKNTQAWNDSMNALNIGIDTIFGQKKEYDGDKGHTTTLLDNTYDSIQNAAGNFGPIGKFVQFGMGANKLLGNVANKLGAGTDGMTTTDAILGSSFMQLTPLGLINGFGGKRADTITKNNEIFELAGASYTATNDTVNRALEKSGKKFGLLSGGSRALTNRLIAEAKRQQQVMTDIVDNATNRFSLRNSMSAINGNRYGFQLEGDYNQKYTQRGKHGLKVSPIIARIVVKKYQEGNKVRTIDQLIKEAKKQNPRFIQRMSEPVKSIPVDNGFGTHLLGYTESDGQYYVYPQIQEDENGELKYYSDWREAFDKAFKNHNVLRFNNAQEAELFTNSGEDKDGNLYGYKKGWQNFFKQTPKHQQGGSIISESFIELLDPNSIPEFKEGGQLTIESEIVPILIEDIEEFKEGGEFNYSTTIELVNPEDLIEEEEQIEEFKEGGSINVIPDGALHARKHNMNMEGITKKGIPVIDNEGKQQCEIEKEEIILRLELTEKLEELQKKYSDYEHSKKERDEIALEAGKLLVQEILYNTQDNTNNLL